MTTVLLTDRDHPAVVIAAESGARTRLRARTRAYSLDRSLAAGASPDTSAALSLRAAQLIGAGARRAVAKSLREVVDQARYPGSPRVCAIPLCRRKVLSSRDSLLELARRLEYAEPVDVRGVARARVLLTSGDGPLYNLPHADDLEPVVLDALAALEVAP